MKNMLFLIVYRIRYKTVGPQNVRTRETYLQLTEKRDDESKSKSWYKDFLFQNKSTGAFGGQTGRSTNIKLLSSALKTKTTSSFECFFNPSASGKDSSERGVCVCVCVSSGLQVSDGRPSLRRRLPENLKMKLVMAVKQEAPSVRPSVRPARLRRRR